MVKSKNLMQKTIQGVDHVDSRFFFFINCVRNVIEKSCKYMRNNSTRQKDFNFTKLKFRAQRYGDMWPKEVGKP